MILTFALRSRGRGRPRPNTFSRGREARALDKSPPCSYHLVVRPGLYPARERSPLETSPCSARLEPPPGDVPLAMRLKIDDLHAGASCAAGPLHGFPGLSSASG